MHGTPFPPVRTVAGRKGDILLTVTDITDAQSVAEKDQPNGYAGLNADGELEGPIILRKDTAANLAGVTLSQGEIAFETDLERLLAGDGATAGGFDAAWGAGGAVVVRPTDDHADNASKLTSAYNIATTLTPGGNALSATNRAVVVLLPGRYDYGDSSGLEMDTEYVDLVGVGSDGAVVINSNDTDADAYTIKQSANDIRVANLSLSSDSGDASHAVWHVASGQATTSTRMVGVRFIDGGTSICSNAGSDWNGTYLYCIAGDLAFGHSTGSIASGTFRGCVAGDKSFAGYGPGGFDGGGDATGTFYDCKAGAFSFGADEASGTFYNCVAGDESFGAGNFSGGGNATGTFYNCKAGAFSFGADEASGTFYSCVAGDRSFGAVTFSGEAHDCHGGADCFGGFGIFSGKAYDCSATGNPFGFQATGADAEIIRCYTTGRTYAIEAFEGIIEDSVVEITGANTDALIVGDGARVYNCTLVATGTGKSVNAASAINAKIAHCRMNLGLGANVTNDIATPYNVVDTDIAA